jgi:hypothetical protein
MLIVVRRDLEGRGRFSAALIAGRRFVSAILTQSISQSIVVVEKSFLATTYLRGFGLDLAAVAKELDVYESAQIDSFGT